MPLWGTSDSDESKPKNLTTAEKKEVYATNSGWVREAGSILSGNGNTDADPEVLVAVSGLADSIGAQNILKPGGATLKDTADGTTDAAVAISGAQGTAAGTLTVTA